MSRVEADESKDYDGCPTGINNSPSSIKCRRTSADPAHFLIPRGLSRNVLIVSSQPVLQPDPHE